MIRLWEATSVRLTPSPGKHPSISATTFAAAPSLTTSGSFLPPTAGKSLCWSKVPCNVWLSELESFHCCLFFSPYSQIAILGDHHIWNHEGTEQFMSVDAIYWHENYDYQTLDYDIMLMKLAHPVTVNQYVKPIALPEACPTPGDMCMVSGWGTIYADPGEVHLKVLKNQLCFWHH